MDLFLTSISSFLQTPESDPVKSQIYPFCLSWSFFPESSSPTIPSFSWFSLTKGPPIQFFPPPTLDGSLLRLCNLIYQSLFDGDLNCSTFSNRWSSFRQNHLTPLVVGTTSSKSFSPSSPSPLSFGKSSQSDILLLSLLRHRHLSSKKKENVYPLIEKHRTTFTSSSLPR